MTELKQVPLTTYGLLARKHGVKNPDYVSRIVNGKRRAIRGKAAAILEDWNKLKDNPCSRSFLHLLNVPN